MASVGGFEKFLLAREATFGTQASTPYLTFRAKRGSVQSSKEAAVSELLRGDREKDANIRTFLASQANLETELLANDPAMRELISRVLFSSYVHSDLADATKGRTIAPVTGTFTVATAANTLTRSAGSFITEGVVAGMWIAFKDPDQGANDGYWKVLSVDSATVLTLATPGISFTGAIIADLTNTSPAADGDEVYSGRYCRNSVLKKGLTIERGHTDIAQFLRTIGWIGSMTIGLTAKQIGSVSFTGLGTGFASAGTTVDAGPTAPGTSSAISASTNVARLTKDGVVVGGVRSLTLEVANDPEQLAAVGSLTAYDVISGLCDLKGSLEAFFTDRTVLHDALVNHTAIALEAAAVNDQGDLLAITVPRVNLMTGGVDPAGTKEPGVEKYTISGVKDPTLLYTIQVADIAKLA